jgi:hypothetical protein
VKGHQFNSFWYGSALPPVEWACLSSFIERGHRVRLFCYDAVKAPTGVSLADASEIAPREAVSLFNGSVAAFTDLFRYKLISKYGEWWTDTDIYCLKDDIPECRYAWACQDDDLINGAVLKFPPNDPTLNAIHAAAREIKQTFWTEVGPALLTKHLRSWNFDDHFGNRNEFYPIHWSETFLFWLSDYSDVVQERCHGSYFVHLWTSVFPHIGIDPHMRPPKGSFLATILLPHLWNFNLRELHPETSNRTIESIRSYCSRFASDSERLVGCDLSTFPFDKYLVPVAAYSRNREIDDLDLT